MIKGKFAVVAFVLREVYVGDHALVTPIAHMGMNVTQGAAKLQPSHQLPSRTSIIRLSIFQPLNSSQCPRLITTIAFWTVTAMEARHAKTGIVWKKIVMKGHFHGAEAKSSV